MSSNRLGKRTSNLNYLFRVNERIPEQDIRLIDENGSFVGIMPTSQALNIAREKELDLIEVAPNANPPVCKITSWSKFKYEYTKKNKKSTNKGSQIKEIWLKPMTGVGDLDHKVRKIKEFLDNKCKVKITVKPGKDRRLDKSFYFEQIDRVLEMLGGCAEFEIPPKMEGKCVYAIIKRKK